MIQRRGTEIDLLGRRYGAVASDEDVTWFRVVRLRLPSGWSLSETSVLVMVPAGYPVTPPDNFYTENALRLIGGGEPANSSGNQSILGTLWRVFSYHVDVPSWKPDPDPKKGHNLVTFMLGVEARLREPN